MVPRAILTIPSVPLLGTGKVDYPAVQRIVKSAARLLPVEHVPA